MSSEPSPLRGEGENCPHWYGHDRCLDSRNSPDVEPLASAAPADVAVWLGPTLQRYFTDPAMTAAEGRRKEIG
jgi:hypothetical protein